MASQAPTCPDGYKMDMQGKCQMIAKPAFQRSTEYQKGGINSDLARAKEMAMKAGEDVKSTARNLGSGLGDVAKSSWNTARKGYDGAVAGAKNVVKADMAGAKGMMQHEGSVMAEDIYKAKHREKMVAVEDNSRVEHNTGEAQEAPVYTFLFSTYTPAQTFINFVLFIFFIFLVVFLINYSFKSPMRQQAQYERNKMLLRKK